MLGGESVFTLDVGSGTQDFMLFAEENERNCPKRFCRHQREFWLRRLKG
ncbi:hypothetical protein [Archaeoglobus fulgidus]|nr:hypothetical protein [Archaeoglobus fulgidus]